MEIRFFKTIDEWVKSNPDVEAVTRILSTINKGVIAEIKKAIMEKNSELKKMERMVNLMYLSSI